MLRTALLAVALLLMLLGIGGLLAGYPSWAPAIWGVALLLCVLFERWRYQRLPTAAPGNWQATGEQFVDPETGQAMEVLYDPDTGDRRYTPIASPQN